MLTKIIVRNFKRFDEIDIELGERVVFIGPNNSGKTSAMQALTLWEIGVKRWHEKRSNKSQSERRKGIAINRRDLLALPHPSANLLWRKRHTRDVSHNNGKQIISNVRIDVIVEGVSNDKEWRCGLEFDYANEESFYCRPLRIGDKASEQMPVPEEAAEVDVAFLPPMSGLAETETLLVPGTVNVLVGQGRTAEVLRNLCWQIAGDDDDKASPEWEELTTKIKNLFGAELTKPRFMPDRGEIVMGYRERGSELDLSSSGRGLQQTLLILAYMHANPGGVILLDEPDAHLEILRQRQIYELIDEAASKSGNQIIAASHSEVLLNEAASKDVVVAFVGKPHRIDDKGSQIRKALASIGFDQYHQAEQTGWVLYLEGSTDLAILKSFAKSLGHDAAMQALERPFVHYAGNLPNEAKKHFYGLREASPDLQGIALFDRLDKEKEEALDESHSHLTCLVWKRREIENYLCTLATLKNYARHTAQHESAGPIFAQTELPRREKAMNEAIDEISGALKKLKKGDPWDANTKVSDDFLNPLFQEYFKRLELPNLMEKTNFHILAEHVPKEEIDSEIKEKLDAIAEVASKAKPASDD